ncbi:MAG: YbhB/YbcL family Raf kinase inhibitor-like protein [Acidobacteriota bacterium]
MKILVTTILASAAFAATAGAAPFALKSTDFKPYGTLSDKQAFNSFGCTGENVSPELEWSNPPAGTKSFALMVHDPDAPTGSGWWHWVVYNIPADAKSLPAGAGTADGKHLPAGAVQGNTDFGTPGYGGPCPPAGSGKHHYEFTLFALKVDKLDLPKNATAAFVGFNVQGNAIGKAKLTGMYGRKK